MIARQASLGTLAGEQAREYLTSATTMYREMDMPFWLQEAESHVRALS